jgi:membrane protein DedA with SNARE-associated domain
MGDDADQPAPAPVGRHGDDTTAPGAGADGADQGAVGSAPGRGRRPSKRTLTIIAVPIAVMVVCRMIGDAAAPSLVDTHPLWLLALSPRTRNMVLVTNQLDAWTYYPVALARLVASDPLFFLLGYWYGDAAITWMEKRTRTWGSTLRSAEGWFAKASYPIVFAAPNEYVCLFAGAAGMPVAAFLVLNISGTLFRLYLVRRFGDAFDGPIDGIVEWIGDHRAPVLVVTIGLAVGSFLLEARKGETEVGSIANLDEELEAAAAEVEARRAADATDTPEAADEPEAPPSASPTTPTDPATTDPPQPD